MVCMLMLECEFPIQVSKTRSENCLSMELTGMQGDVMKESMKCAKTMAWSLLEKRFKMTLMKKTNLDYTSTVQHSYS